MSIREIEFKALAIIAMCCPNLKELTFSNCEFDFVGGRGSDFDTSDQEYDRVQQFIQMARDASQIMTTFSSLESVSFLSPCNRLYLSFVLTRCPKIKHIRLGTQTGVNDATLDKILKAGVLMELEEFHCEHTPNLTAESVRMLIDICPNLRQGMFFRTFFPFLTTLFCWMYWMELLHYSTRILF